MIQQAAPADTQHAIDAAYRSQRARLAAAVTAASAATWANSYADPEVAAAQVVPIVEAGQGHVAALVAAYMAAKSRAETGVGTVAGLDAGRYTIEAIRGLPAIDVYKRPFSTFEKAQREGADIEQAVTSGQATLDKLVRTDLQLAQTHAARDVMHADPRIVGWRRVLTGATSCPLCTVASTRTYRKADLMPIHEHCDCIVEPLWGTEPVASIGTTVRVEEDSEIGPRLMADTWAPVGPRLV